MTSASSLAFPGSRTLATWWQQLAPFAPRSLRVGYLFVHRLEAAGSWLQPRPLEPLLQLVLESLALGPLAAAHLLNSRLPLGTPVLSRLLQSSESARLVAGPPWVLTEE